MGEWSIGSCIVLLFIQVVHIILEVGYVLINLIELSVEVVFHQGHSIKKLTHPLWLITKSLRALRGSVFMPSSFPLRITIYLSLKLLLTASLIFKFLNFSKYILNVLSFTKIMLSHPLLINQRKLFRILDEGFLKKEWFGKGQSGEFNVIVLG